MKTEIIEIDSYVGTKLQIEHAVQGSDTLVVLLPGSVYTIMGPSLFYAYSMATEAGYDVLAMEYGYQKNNKKLLKEEFPLILEECRKVISKALDRGYSRLIFIGKSFGTIIMSSLIDEYKKIMKVSFVFISPVLSAWDIISSRDCMVIIGTKDQFFKEITISELLELGNVETYLVEGGDHFLEVGDFSKSIDVMKESTMRIKKYMSR